MLALSLPSSVRYLITTLVCISGDPWPDIHGGELVVQKQYRAIFHVPLIFWRTTSSWFASANSTPDFVVTVPTKVVLAKAQSAFVGTTSSILSLTWSIMVEKIP